MRAHIAESYCLRTVLIDEVPIKHFRTVDVYSAVKTTFVYSREGAIRGLCGYYDSFMEFVKIFCIIKDFKNTYNTHTSKANRFIYFCLINLFNDDGCLWELPEKFSVYKELPTCVIDNTFLCSGYISTR